MSTTIERLERDRRDEWDNAVDQAEGATVFHQYDALEQLAEYSGTTLHALMGFKGQEPIGMFPVFEMQKGPLSAVFSPPPNLWIPRLGPAFVNRQQLHQRKRERRRRRLIDDVTEWVDDECSARYVRVRTAIGVTDTRPFKWNDCTVSPEYTYVADLTAGREALLDRFNSNARNSIRRGRDADGEYTIAEEEGDAAVRIMKQVKHRYQSQDEAFPVPVEFPKALYETLPDGQIRPYVFRVDGEFQGGGLAFDYNGTVAGWLGSAKPSSDVDLPINDLLNWQLMCDAMERGRTTFEIVGAGDPRLNKYKTKFGPDLEPFFTVERSSLPMDALMEAYRRLTTAR